MDRVYCSWSHLLLLSYLLMTQSGGQCQGKEPLYGRIHCRAWYLWEHVQAVFPDKPQWLKCQLTGPWNHMSFKSLCWLELLPVVLNSFLMWWMATNTANCGGWNYQSGRCQSASYLDLPCMRSEFHVQRLPWLFFETLLKQPVSIDGTFVYHI